MQYCKQCIAVCSQAIQTLERNLKCTLRFIQVNGNNKQKSYRKQISFSHLSKIALTELPGTKRHHFEHQFWAFSLTEERLMSLRTCDYLRGFPNRIYMNKKRWSLCQRPTWYVKLNTDLMHSKYTNTTSPAPLLAAGCS